jgi:eukaryotic-like serine/threonine-protein kinase
MGHLGRYQLIGRLATGGMAEVYLALSGELTGFRTLVVVKRILPHLASNHQFIRMFFDEARIAALLDHPNVVRIIEVGHDGDEYFLVMELVQGKPLSAVLRKAAKEKSPLTPALAAFVVAQAANGLGYAHNLVDAEGQALNVVHRDVSPQNILVSFEGAVKMIDFGIARALGRVTETSPGGLKGKIEYMAPEQASAEEVDLRADVFALGVVLWEALTGRRLFRRDTDLAIMRAIVDEPIPRPSEMVSISPQLEAIVMRALDKQRSERFQTAQEMALVLERYAFSSEGFSPLQLATYMKGLFATEFAQWKKTVSSALEMDTRPGHGGMSGTSFPVLRPDLPTRGPTVALRKGRSSPGATPATDLVGAPTRRDRLFVYGGLGALAIIATAGVLVLSRRPAAVANRPIAPAASAPLPTPAPPVAQVAAPAPTAAPDLAPAAARAPFPDDAAARATAAHAAPAGTRPRPSRSSRSRSRAAAAAAARAGRSEDASAAKHTPVSADHRPNPFE